MAPTNLVTTRKRSYPDADISPATDDAHRRGDNQRAHLAMFTDEPWQQGNRPAALPYQTGPSSGYGYVLPHIHVRDKGETPSPSSRAPPPKKKRADVF